jgi:hypothetical protein
MHGYGFGRARFFHGNAPCPLPVWTQVLSVIDKFSFNQTRKLHRVIFRTDKGRRFIDKTDISLIGDGNRTDDCQIKSLKKGRAIADPAYAYAL